MIEKMNDFFTARIDGYDRQMMENVEGCKDAYSKMADLLPKNTKTLLDLGCGTGLELEGVFARFPDISVTGVDLTEAMLQRLGEKYPDKDITLVCDSYFDYDFGVETFDAVISFQTMHHFSHGDKLSLYRRILDSLREEGVYIESDYMVLSEEEESKHLAENQRLRTEQGIASGEFYHYDTPFTVEHQILLFKKAGFKGVNQVFRQGNTTIIVCEK